MSEVRLPSWSWAFAAFRFADGVTHALVPLIPLIVYDMPIWAVAATVAIMNLASVPAGFAWSRLMDKTHGIGRRRMAVTGFSIAAVALVGMALQLGFWFHVLFAVVFTAFGVASAPAASVLILEASGRRSYSAINGALIRRTGLSYLAGSVLAVAWGLTGTLDTRVALGVGALVAGVAAMVANGTIAPASKPLPTLDVPGNARRFERMVWFPRMLRHGWKMGGTPLRGPPLRFAVVVLLFFVGSSMLFSTYPGVLADRWGLGLGLVLLSQAPSQFVTPFMVGRAGQMARATGELKVFAMGSDLRLLVVPGLAAVILFGSTPWLPLVLVLHAAAGLSFALMQVGGIGVLSHSHPGGHGEGIGTHHASVALGGLIGSTVSSLLLLWADLTVVVVALSVVIVVAWLLMRGLRHEPSLGPQDADE